MPVACVLCPQTYVYVPSLIHHMLKEHPQTGIGRETEAALARDPNAYIVTLNCPFCPRRFQRKSSAKTHIQNAHPDKPQPIADELHRRTFVRHPFWQHLLVLESSLPWLRKDDNSDAQIIVSSRALPSASAPGRDDGPTIKRRRYDPATNALVIGTTESRPPTLATRREFARPDPDPTGNPIASFDEASLLNTFHSLVLLPTTFDPLPPGIATTFHQTMDRLAKAALRSGSDLDLINFLSAPKIALATGLFTRTTTQRLHSHPNNGWPSPKEMKRQELDPVTKATRLVESGRLGAAMSVLTNESTIAPFNDTTLDTLRGKFPPGIDRPFTRNPRPHKPLRNITVGDIRGALYSIANDTSPGISGFTPHLLKLAAKSQSVLDLLAHIANGIVRGTAGARDVLTTSRLSPLSKPDGGVRPICCGDLPMRVCAKAILRASFRKEMLATCQFGIGSPGGAEPIVRLINLALRDQLGQRFTHLLSLDISNAFPSLPRPLINEMVNKYAPELANAARWLLGEGSHMVVRDGETFRVIMCSEGIEQGGPLSGLFFSIGVRDVVEGLQSYLGSSHRVVAYYDDIFVLAPDENVDDRVYEFATQRDFPLEINKRKTKVQSLDDIRAHGTDILGTKVGAWDAQREKVQEANDRLAMRIAKMESLPTQYQLQLLRICALPALAHLARTLDPTATKHTWLATDDIIAAAIGRMKWQQTDPEKPWLSHALITLPLRMGGLSLTSYHDICEFASAASNSLADHSLAQFIPSISEPTSIANQRKRCEEWYSERMRKTFERIPLPDRITIIENGSVLGRMWLTTAPTSPRLRISDAEMAAGLRMRLLDIRSVPKCWACGKMTCLVYHADSCQANRSIWMNRHNSIKYPVGNALGTIPDSTVEFEPTIRHRGNAMRKNDVRFSGNADRGLRPLEMDMAVHSLQTKSATASSNATNIPFRSDLVEDAMERAKHVLKERAQEKIKNLPANIVREATFHPIVLSAGGLMETNTQLILKRFSKQLAPGAFTFMQQRMAIGLFKSRALSIIRITNLQTLPIPMASPHNTNQFAATGNESETMEMSSMIYNGSEDEEDDDDVDLIPDKIRKRGEAQGGAEDWMGRGRDGSGDDGSLERRIDDLLGVQEDEVPPTCLNDLFDPVLGETVTEYDGDD